MRCLIDIDQWAAAHLPGIEGLAWEHCDEATRRQLFAGGDRPLRFEDTSFAYEEARFDGIVRRDQDESLPTVTSSEGVVGIESMDWSLVAPLMPFSLPAELMLDVDYRIARLRLDSRRLARLRRHDVLLIPAGPAFACIGDRPVLSFNFTMEYITVNDIFTHLGNEPFEDTVASPTGAFEGLDLSTLPVTIDVVLCRLSHSLSFLAECQPGTTLALPADAHCRVELRVNGQRIAAGELVQVGDNLGVQIAEPPVST
jgi:type III secretion protein Q